jgi:glutamine synthetase
MTSQGRLDTDTLGRLVSEEAVDTVIAAFPDMYGRLVGKRFTGRHFMTAVLEHGMHACDYLMACDMEMEPVPGYAFTSWAKGYGDFHPVPDLQTMRLLSWHDRTALVLCDVRHGNGDELLPYAPRSVLRRQVERAARAGYVAKGASELELYLFRDSYEQVAQKKFIDLEPIGPRIEDYLILQGTKEEFLVGAIRRHLERSGIPVESSKGEWGPGQQEIGLCHSELVEMADRHTLYKHAAKEIAWQAGHAVTFMAKWDERYAGSSCHIHLSLCSAEDGQPLFPGDEELNGVHCSRLFRWFLGGWMHHLRELFAFCAPYPTSYKRHLAGSFAPTAIAWSVDNRTTGFRVVGEGSSLRIECRAPGADVNPYLVFAGSLAAGLDGIAKQIEPPAAFTGDAYTAQELPRVPQSLNEAIAALEQSEWAREVLGENVVEHYLHFFRTEQRKFDGAVTDWERRRYFEQA